MTIAKIVPKYVYFFTKKVIDFSKKIIKFVCFYRTTDFRGKDSVFLLKKERNDRR